MAATFAGIEIGRTGLNISQLGLDVTSHNIANVETPGYTRQRIIQTAYDPFSTIGRLIPVSEALVGGGVRVKILDQIRSAYLDRRYRTENTTNAYWLKRTEGLTYLESYFDNVNEETSFSYSIAKFFEAIKILAEDPVEGAPRKLLQTAGMDLTQQLSDVYRGLIDLQDTHNQAVKITVEDINRIANEIVELNKSIYGFEVTGYIANDLRDKRNLLLDELSSLIDIEYREEPDSKGGTKLVVEIGGKTLVDHDISNKLDVALGPNAINGEDDVWVPVWAANPTLVPKIDAFGQYSAYFNGLDGSINSLVFNASVNRTIQTDVQNAVKRINEIAAEFAKITPEWDPSFAINPANMPPDAYLLYNELTSLVGNVDIFAMQPNPWDWCVHTGINIGGVDFVYACSDQVNAQSVHGYARIESDVVYSTPEPLEVKNGELKAYLDLRDSDDAKTPGIPYYIEMLNNLARALVQEINEVHREGYTDPPGGGSESGINFFWAKDSAGNYLPGAWLDDLGNPPASPADVDMRDPVTGKRIYNYVLDISQVTAKNICLSEEVTTSVYNIACSTTKIVKQGLPNELQEGNNKNMNLLYELFLKNNITVNGVDIGGFDSYMTSIRFDVGNTLSFAKKTAINSTTLLLAAENQRVSVSGVSLDEEMINMVKYQHAYSGASRVITAIDEMLDKLINGTGRVGL